MRRTRFLVHAALVLLAGAHAAQAQRLLVRTTAMTAARQPARLYLQTVDLDLGAVQAPRPLPGVAMLGRVLVSEQTGATLSATALTLRPPDRPGPPAWNMIDLFQTCPLMLLNRLCFADEWRYTPACLMPDGEVVLLGFRQREQEGCRGRIQILAISGKTWRLTEPFEFDGKPVAAAVMGAAHVAVLCDENIPQSSRLRFFDTDAARELRHPTDLTDVKALSSSTAVGLAFLPGENVLTALTSGRTGDPTGLDSSSWVHVIDAGTCAEIGAALELAGAAPSDTDALFPIQGRSCWIATRPPGTDFAYATYVTMSKSGPTKESQIMLGSVSGHFLIAPSEDGAWLAVAVDNRIEIRAKNGRQLAAHAFDEPVTTIRTVPAGVLVGETGRVHLVRATDAGIEKTVQLQSGWVTELLPITPERPDQLPAPDAAPFQSNVPDVVIFRGEAVGQEIKALSIEPIRPAAAWSIDYDKIRMPWLVVHPLSGMGAGVIYMGVDPARYRVPDAGCGAMTITVSGDSTYPAESKVLVLVGVVPEEGLAVRRILWLWGEQNVCSMRTDPTNPLHDIAEILAKPPRYFAHYESSGPFHDDLDPYTVVVLTADAALHGCVTRPVLLDYVFRGGALLFLGAYQPHSPGDAEGVQWLAPAGIELDMNVRVDGYGRPLIPHPLTVHCDALEIAGGCAVYVNPEAPALAAIPGRDQHVALAARNYGQGRIAVLAAPTPLENRAIQTDSGRLFAGDLFQWLALAGRDIEFQDMDSDGLPDAVEDRNQNGVVDPGETDYLAPDSDRDGLPDGAEDANGNGVVDEGETSALVADTDGDGIHDAADVAPLPPMAAPFISGVSPATGPGEGGTLVVISGRNFMPDTTVVFGEHTAPHVRQTGPTSLLAETPPCDDAPRYVDLRVFSPAAKTGFTLSEAFCYGPRSEVRIAGYAIETMRRDASRHEGTIVFLLKNPDNAAISRVILTLKPDVTGQILWRPDGDRRPYGTEVRVADGRLIIASTRLHARLTFQAALAAVPFTWNEPADGPLRLKVEFAEVVAANGQLLDVDTADLVIPLSPSGTSVAATASATISNQ